MNQIYSQKVARLKTSWIGVTVEHVFVTLGRSPLSTLLTTSLRSTVVR